MEQDDYTIESLVLNESFQRYCLGTDEADKVYWEGWLENNPDRKMDFLKAKEIYTVLNGGNHALDFEKNKTAFQNRLINESIINKAVPESIVVQMTGATEKPRTISIYKIFAAAAIFAGVIIGAYFLLNNEKKTDVANIDSNEKQITDKEPGSNKAILTLADGKTIILDSLADGLISQQGAIKVINVNGLLTYQHGGENTEVHFNTISTPKGGQYQFLLSDGSKVWLNASSSLRFPSIFIGDDRTVELNGEGYFEIAHNSAKPFHVKVNELDVKVLGTDFNVMAYGDEESIKTTLLKGRVKVQKERAFIILAPGQQAQINKDGAIRLDKSANVEEAIAWKNGIFQFDGADMRTVMRHIGRWYDIETVLQGDMKNIHLGGRLSRNLNLSQVIQVLEESGIEIKLKGNKMIASPKP